MDITAIIRVCNQRLTLNTIYRDRNRNGGHNLNWSTKRLIK